MNDWNIQSRAHACQSCEQKFADKQPYFTLLFDGKHELTRLDVCEPCWKAKFAEDSAPDKKLISRWQGVYETPPAAPPEAIQKESAETLLRKLIEQNDPKHAAACFILAVMLERKRLLKIKEQFKRDGERIFVYEQPKTGDIFTIADPNLQLDQLEDVQRDVADLLENGLNPPAATGDAPPTEATGIPAENQTAENPTGESSVEPSAEHPPEPSSEEQPASEEDAEPAKN